MSSPMQQKTNLKPELALVEAENWDFEAVISLADESEARERQRRQQRGRPKIIHGPSPIDEAWEEEKREAFRSLEQSRSWGTSPA